MPDTIKRSTLGLRFRCNGMAHSVALAGAAGLLLLLAGTPAQAGQSRDYRFTTLIDSALDGLVPDRCAAINTLGTVTVQVEDTAAGFNKLVTKRGADDAPVVLADTQRVADSPTFCDNGFSSITSDPSINELGEVAFQGNLRRITDRVSRPDCQVPEQTGGQRQGVFLAKGSQRTTIAHTKNEPGGSFISEFVVADTSVNSFGKVALVPELDGGSFDQGLYVGSKTGTFEKRFLTSEGRFDAPSSRVSLNEVGQIAFEDSGIVLSNPDGTFTTIIDSADGFDFVSSASLNIFGRVAFEGAKIVGDDQILGVFTSRGGPVTTVADSTGGYAFFQEPSLNDLGDVVFTADLDEFTPDGRFVQGVFTGPNPKSDKVLQVGDHYDGVPVTGVFTCSEALNNLGQIVMTVFSEDPNTFERRTFIVKATPKHLHGVD
jgi:hypothetical protein